MIHYISFGNTFFKEISKEEFLKAKRRLPTKALAKDLEKALDTEIKKFERELVTAPSGRVREIFNEVRKNLIEKFKDIIDRKTIKNYLRIKKRVGRIFKRRLDFTSKDVQAIKILSENKVLSDMYEGMDEFLSKKINNAIKESTERGALDMGKLIKRIKGITGMTYERAERISRTETGKIGNLAAANSFEQVGEEIHKKIKVKWIGPTDARTTDYCRKISELTAGGVSLERLKEIIKIYGDTSLAFRPDYFVHINCRHTMTPVM